MELGIAGGVSSIVVAKVAGFEPPAWRATIDEGSVLCTLLASFVIQPSTAIPAMVNAATLNQSGPRREGVLF